MLLSLALLILLSFFSTSKTELNVIILAYDRVFLLFLMPKNNLMCVKTNDSFS